MDLTSSLKLPIKFSKQLIWVVYTFWFFWDWNSKFIILWFCKFWNEFIWFLSVGNEIYIQICYKRVYMCSCQRMAVNPINHTIQFYFFKYKFYQIMNSILSKLKVVLWKKCKSHVKNCHLRQHTMHSENINPIHSRTVVQVKGTSFFKWLI